MNYSQAEQFLLSLSNIPRKEYENSGGTRKLYTKRMKSLLELLGKPEQQLKHTIHVAGTSGKGSVSTYLSNILIAANKKTGLMISPHPTYLCERWQINGTPMDETAFIRLMKRVKVALDKYEQKIPGDAPSHFEVVTAIGFVYFAEQKVDWSVIEVGMGGRYDATNTITHKDIAVITSIGLDHTDVLGNTKEKIAYEKAGIIKPNSKIFTSEKNKKVISVIEKECKKNKVSLKISNPKFLVQNQNTAGTDFLYQNQNYHIQTLGKHQITNAILCIDIARELGIPEMAIKSGLANAVQPLRFEIINNQPTIILDGAHNPDKMKTTIEAMGVIKKRHDDILEKQSDNGKVKLQNNTHLIIGFSADKDWKNMTKLLLTLNPVSIACTRNTVNPFRKVVSPKEIIEFVQTKKPFKEKNIQPFLDPIDALNWSRTKLSKHDILLVTGSIFLSGEIRPALTNE